MVLKPKPVREKSLEKGSRDPISDGLGGAMAGAISGIPFLWTGSVPFDLAMVLTAIALAITVLSLSYDAINRKTKASPRNVTRRRSAN
jgi:hypothetical protein